MSNKAHRSWTPKHIFPTFTPDSIFDQVERALMKVPHDVHIEDLGHQVSAVVCSCGMDTPAPFGHQQALKIRENHLARYHIIHDPMGAKYRE